MKISVIGPTYPYKGGISHFTTCLVQELKNTHEVDFISWKRQYPSFLYPVEMKDTQSKQHIKTDVKYILDFFNPYTWMKAVMQVKKMKSDILLLTWASPVQSPIYTVLSLFIKLFTKCKIAYVCHNVLPHERAVYDIPLTKLAFKFADYFIVHSSEDKDILEKLVKNKTITKGFLPLFNFFENTGTYNVEHEKQSIGLNKKVLLFFGYIRPYKGLKYLINAMPQIIEKHPDISLLVVGEFWSKDKQSYFDMVQKLDLKNHVKFVDSYVPNEELGKYFAVSDVVVLPYLTASQSAAVQTAYAFNKPVISTSVGGLKDVISEGVTGYIIQPESSEDIVLKVSRFFTSWNSSEKLKEYADQFSWSNYTKLFAFAN